MNEKKYESGFIPRKLMRTPRQVDIDITNRCNLRCRYCYHFGSAGDVKKDLPAGEWLKFFTELGEAAVMNVTLCGGEPFIRDDLMEILQGIIDNHMRFSILSNGTLITEEIAHHIADTNRCNTIQVSLDGSNPEIHDSCRGAGSFIRAVDGIRCLQRMNIPVSIRVTIYHQNVGDLDAIARFILEDLKIPSFSTNAADYQGLGMKNFPDLQLTIDDRNRAMKELVRLKKKYNGRITAQAGPLAEAEHFSRMQKGHLAGEKIEGRGILSACGCPWEKISVRADGIFVPCMFLSHIELGRINIDSLADVWQNNRDLNTFRNRRTISLESFQFCKGCEYIHQCTGGCPGGAYTRKGDEYHPNPGSCLRLFLLNGGELVE